MAESDADLVETISQRGQALNSSRVMPFLPPEISHRIAEHLSKPSALTLLRTCKSLAAIGEVRIWTKLDATGTPKSGDQMHNTPEDYRRRAEIVDRRSQGMLAALVRCPHRAGLVRSIRLEPSSGGKGDPRARALIQILELVAPYIRRLEMLPVELSIIRGTSVVDDYPYGSFFTMLDTANMSFPQLKHLCLGRAVDEAAPRPASLGTVRAERAPAMAEAVLHGRT